MAQKKISAQAKKEFIEILHKRFEKNMHRHPGISWDNVLKAIEKNPSALWSLDQMESSGGEPDVVSIEGKKNEIVFADCSAESPKERRSLCYDRSAWESRKENKPSGDAVSLAEEMGISLLSESEYRQLQQLGEFALKTSSWILTPDKIRKLGGALFCDRRFDTVFVYHNGAESYYAARGFRGMLKI
ncbi:MAG: DUF4256 domain-containing protein [Saprospiraceae bacterium]